MTAGIAANKPIAVAINASAIPGATICKVACLAPLNAIKACIIPQTVPNKPIYGLTEATVAKNGTRLSSISTSRFIAKFIAREVPLIIASGASGLTCFKRENSLKPTKKICSLPVNPSRRFDKPSYNLFKSSPDQKRSSKVFASFNAFVNTRLRWIIIVQEIIENEIKITITS